MKKLLLTLICLSIISTAAMAQTDAPAPAPAASPAATETAAPVSPEKRAQIEKMLKTTGVEKMMGQMMGQMISNMKAQSPQIPDEFWTKFQSKLDTHEFVMKLIPVYDKYYTLDDLKAINAFYESSTGQKVLTVLPQIMQESMKIGQEWGQKVGQQAMEDLKQEKPKADSDAK